MLTTEEFLKHTGLPEKYKGFKLITKILNECDFDELFETPTINIIKVLAKIYKTSETNIKKDILYAKQKHLEVMPTEIKVKLFGAKKEPSTKEYLLAIKIAITNDIANILPTKNW